MMQFREPHLTHPPTVSSVVRVNFIGQLDGLRDVQVAAKTLSLGVPVRGAPGGLAFDSTE